jgi:uncharacterized membrane protein YfcA
VTVITDPLFYVLAVPAVLALGLSKGGFSGVGQMATPLLALAMPPLEAAAIFLPIMIVQDCFALWVYRKDWSGRLLAVLMPGVIIGVGLAWVLASYISDAAVRIFIGVTTIAYVLYIWIGPAQAARKVDGASAGKGVFKGVFLGAVAGFTSLLCQAGAPPYQMYALSQNLSKMTFVGTAAIFFAAMNWLKVVPYLALGQFSMKGLGTSLVLLPLAILTNQIGFWVVRITPAALFFRITMIVLFLISLELTRNGLTDILR